MLCSLPYWRQIPQHSLDQSPSLEAIKTLVFQYRGYFMFRQIEAWYPSSSQQLARRISYDNYSYNIIKPLCKILKANFKGWFVSCWELRFSCALITEQQKYCKRSGDGKKQLQKGKWQYKNKGGKKRLSLRTAFIYKNLFRWSHKQFNINLQTLHVMHIIETIKKSKGEQIMAVFSWNN